MWAWEVPGALCGLFGKYPPGTLQSPPGLFSQAVQGEGLARTEKQNQESWDFQDFTPGMESGVFSLL